MIEDFELESLQKLVISTDSVEDAKKTERRLESVKNQAKREGLFSGFEVTKEGTNIVISASELSGIQYTLYQLKAISAEDLQSLSKQLRGFKKTEQANKAAAKLVGNNNMYTPAKRQLGGYPRIEFSQPEKQPAKISPELEAALARQKAVKEKRLAMKK